MLIAIDNISVNANGSALLPLTMKDYIENFFPYENQICTNENSGWCRDSECTRLFGDCDCSKGFYDVGPRCELINPGNSITVEIGFEFSLSTVQVNSADIILMTLGKFGAFLRIFLVVLPPGNFTFVIVFIF